MRWSLDMMLRVGRSSLLLFAHDCGRWMEFNGGLEEFCLVVDLDMLATSLEVSSVWFPIHDLYLPKRGRLETPLRSEN